MPSRISWLWVCTQSGLASTPPETLSHSTRTVPLNFFGFVGRYTTTRVTNGAASAAVTVHIPSAVSGAALV